MNLSEHLTYDGDVSPPDPDRYGLTFSLTVEPDHIDPQDAEDSDFLGLLSPIYDHNTERPAGFTGRARKLYPQGWRNGQGGPAWWWEPPTGNYALVDREAEDRFADYVTRILADGYYVFTVTATDAAGNTYAASLHANDSDTPDEDTISDLADEATADFIQHAAMLLNTSPGRL